MKTGLKTKWGLFLVIVLVFFAGQVVRAERSWVCELTVTGEICAIIAKNDEEEEPSAIVVSDDCDSDTSPDTINGIPFDKLDKYLEEMGTLAACGRRLDSNTSPRVPRGRWGS